MTGNRFGIEELVDRVERRVDDAGLSPASGQVADRLSVRTVRYYATRGLLGPPAAKRGRQVLYDEGHVDRLVAVKRLQAEGLHLAEIEAALAGVDDARVAAFARGEIESLPTATATPAAGGPAAGPAAVVYDLGDGVSLQVPAGHALGASAEEIAARARTALEQHQPLGREQPAPAPPPPDPDR